MDKQSEVATTEITSLAPIVMFKAPIVEPCTSADTTPRANPGSNDHLRAGTTDGTEAGEVTTDLNLLVTLVSLTVRNWHGSR